MSAFRDERDTELDQQALDSIYSRGKVRNDAINNPGLFTGTGQLWKAPLIGLKVGADSLGKTVTDTVAATNELYAGSLYASHLSFDAALGTDKAVLDSRMAWSQDVREKGEYELSKSIEQGNSWYKGPAGEGTQVLRGLSEMIPRAIVGGRAFGSLGGAFFLAQPEGDKTEIQLKQQGVDAETAALAGDVTVASLAAMSFLPAAGFNKALMADLGLAVGGNVAIGMAQRDQINQVLEQYPEIASQYRAGDSSAIALDTLLGAVFFGMGRAGMKPTEAQKVDLVNNALTVKAVDQSGNVEGVKPTAKGDVKIVQENKKRGLEALITEKPMPEPEPIKTEWAEIEAKADLAGQKRLADEISAAVIRGDIYQPRLDSELPLPPVKQGAPESFASDNLVRSAGNRPDLTSNPQAFAEFESFTTTLESGGKANAKASTSSATGKHQFLKDTWLNTVKQAAPAWANGLDDKALLALRTDPVKSAEMFKVLSDANAADLKKNLLPVNFHNMYAMHHFGPGAGKRFARSAANVPMESILGADAVKANKYLAGQTKAQAIANWESRAKGAGVAGETVFMDPRYNADKWFHPNGIMKGVPTVEGGGLDGVNKRFSAFSKTGSDGNPVRHDGVRLLDERYLPDDAATAVRAFTEATGAPVSFVRNLSPKVRDFNGLIDGERILLNENSTKPLVAVTMHEWTHRLEVEHSDLHQMLVKELNRQKADVAKYGAERKYKPEQAMQELVGDAAGDAAMDPKFWARMAKDNPSAFTKLADVVKAYLDGLLEKIGYGSNRYVKDVEAFRDTLAKVMNVHQARTKGGDDSRQGVFLLEQEIGWAQDGGNRINADSYDEAIEGRTKWQAKSRYDTTELSTFWKDRPSGISEAVARSALAKHRTGEKLVGREVGFIKYALKEAEARDAERAKADAEYVAELTADAIPFSDKTEMVPEGGIFVRMGGKTYPVESFRDAAIKYDQFREMSDAGASELPPVDVVDVNGKVVANFSYNGRLWKGERGASVRDEIQFSDKITPLGDAKEIDVDGVKRPAMNSNGVAIHDTVEGVQNFWRWFGDSKVVDAEGRPLVVYHGTGKKFSKVSLRKGAQGLFWFTSDKSAIEAGDVGAAGKGVIMALYAKIDGAANWKQYDQLMLDEFKSRGLDGAILPDSDGTLSGFIIDRPTQIKSATGNNGDFSPDDARIQFSDKFDDDREPLDVLPEASPEEAAAVARANATPNAEVNFGADIDGKPTDNLADAVAMIQKQREADEARAAKFEKVAKAVLSGGKVAKADQSIGDAIATKYRDLMRLDAEFAGMTNGERIARAAEEAGADAKMMAIKAAQRRALNLAAQLENSEQIKARAPELNAKHKFHAALAERLGQLDGRIRGEQGAARAGMMDVLEAAEPNWLGLVQDDAAVLGLAKEVMGESSGDPRLAKAAKAMQDGFEKLRVTANSLGANIGKLDYGYLPHNWDLGQLMHGGKTLAERTALRMQGKKYTVADAKGDYVKDLMQHGNRDALRNEDGTVMDDAEAAEFYAATFDTLFSEGRNKDSYTTGGKGSRASKQDGKHRVIHFKSAESYIAMMQKYGTGTLLDAVMAHTDRMAKDIALMDEFGANPASTFELLKTQAERYDNATGVLSGGATNDMIWKVLNGELGTPVNMTLAKVGQSARNWVTATALQSVMLSSITDAPLQSLVAKSYGLDVGKNLKNSLEAFGGDTAKEAARLGIVTDYMGSEMALWGQDNVAASSTGKLAEATMRLTGVNRWTYSMRRGAELNLSMGITDWLPKGWDQLEAKTLENMKQSGVTRTDWEIWQQAGLSEFKGNAMLTHADIAKVDHPQAARAAGRYLGMLDDFGKLAVFAPDVRTRAALTQGTQSGTVGGEVARSMMLFKSFAFGMPLRHIRRLKQMDGKSRAEYATAYLVGLTAFGALALQLKQLKDGKDPLDMTESKFWLAAAAQGGGLGILYDIIYKGVDAEGRTGRPNYRGLLGPVFGRGLDAAELGIEGVYAAAGSKKHAKQFREHGARFVSDNTPFTKIWWYKQAVDQMVGHEMRDVISPGYSKKVEQRAAKYGESYYISPDGDVRAPDFEKATGQ